MQKFTIYNQALFFWSFDGKKNIWNMSKGIYYLISNKAIARIIERIYINTYMAERLFSIKYHFL
jgi:hypothetical protein